MSDIAHQVAAIDVEAARAGFSRYELRLLVWGRYNAVRRAELTPDELVDLLEHLQQLPTRLPADKLLTGAAR